MDKPTLYYLVGLPASGKSTWAKKNIDDNTVWLSSDNMREELYGDINNQEHNSELFEKLNKRAKQYLKEGKSVIYDATNINSKRRINFLKALNKIDCNKICIYFCTSIYSCIARDRNRDRSVGFDVIDKMYRNLQIPMYHEGWDSIELNIKKTVYKDINIKLDYDYSMYCSLLDDFSCTRGCIEMGQDNPHHTLNASRHMYFAYDWIKKYTNNKYLKFATLMHDIGKPYVKEYKGRYAHYYGHENVSSQLCVLLLGENSILSDNEIIKIATYIQLHMRMLGLKESNNGKDKFYKLVGKELFEELELLNNADIQAK